MLYDKEIELIKSKVDERYSEIHFIGFAKGFWSAIILVFGTWFVYNYCIK